ncbi:MAG: hypothetical protein Fur0041_05350 [Bacteroidia bacterium]
MPEIQQNERFFQLYRDPDHVMHARNQHKILWCREMFSVNGVAALHCQGKDHPAKNEIFNTQQCNQ